MNLAVVRMMDATPGFPTLGSGLIEKCPTQPSVGEQQTLQEGRNSERERRKIRKRNRGRDLNIDNNLHFIIRTHFPLLF